LANADDLDAPAWRSYRDSALRAPLSAMAGSPADSSRQAAAQRHPLNHSATVDIARIVARAHELIGEPYQWGGESLKSGFDCSGLLVYLYRSVAKRTLPRTTASMIAQRQNAVRRNELRPGDAVFFNHNGEGAASHVGLYIGDNRFIHAPSSGKTIRIDSLDNGYWQRSYTTARRFSG